jgi:hypothetical protein
VLPQPGMEILDSVLKTLSHLVDRSARRPRLVRRAAMHCPHTDLPVEVDFLLGPPPRPRSVLRCTAEPPRPPLCDQACRDQAETVREPASALIVLPPGDDIPDEID